MRRFFTLLSLLAIVATSLLVSDIYKSENTTMSTMVSKNINWKNNPYYTNVGGVEVFPMEKAEIIN